MNRYIIALFCFVVLGASFTAGSWYSRQKAVNADIRRVLYYVDPMNPGHTSEKPGIAPCGMRMEPVYADEGSASQSVGSVPSALGPGTVRVSPEKQQIIGVRLGQVEKASGTYVLRAPGRVVVDETRFFRLVAAIDGWTKQIFPHSTGSLVKKDQPLISFYSKEFLAAQQSYFYGLKTMDRLKQTEGQNQEQLSATADQIRAAEETLQTLGMGDVQIQEIARSRQATRDIILRAPVTGFVLARNVFLGQRFERGTELFRLVDSAHVWILADVFGSEAEQIRPGSLARISLPHSEKVFHAKVSDTLPQFDAASRTLKVRLEMENPDYALRPDMFVDVEFAITLPAALTVPADAVLDSGLKKTVFVDRGNGFFEPRQVETGWRAGNRMEITKGLMVGEKIVVSGNFLIDSESKMRMAAAGMNAPPQGEKTAQRATDPVCGMEVSVEAAKALGQTLEHRGKSYYFCTAECKEKFEKNPEPYLAKPVSKELRHTHASPGASVEGKAHD